jgi:predicted DNA-binding transcriptional regulator YafY
MAEVGKVQRVLDIYSRLMDNELFDAKELAERYGVNERTIERDIADLRAYFADKAAIDSGFSNSIIIDKKSNGYRLEYTSGPRFTDSETLAICKILLESRGLTKIDMDSIMKKLIAGCSTEYSRDLVNSMIKSEKNNYIEPKHNNQLFMDKMWDISKAILSNKYIEINYSRMKGRKTVKRKLMPVAIMFDDYYFYLAAFLDMNDPSRKNFEIENDPLPTIYRLDRIKELDVLDEKFDTSYTFDEAEFRKKTKFMYGGKHRKIHFIYKGLDVDYVIDHIPTAKIIKKIDIPGAEKGEPDKVYEMLADVIGNGVEMWVKSQGDKIEMLS